MYRVKETFEYLIEDTNKFMSVSEVLDIAAGMTCPLWEDYEELPKNSLGDVSYIPWGDSKIEITNLSNKVAIDKDKLLQLIENSEVLSALEAEGVHNWKGYGEAIRELKVGWQKDMITDEVKLSQYLND